MVNKTRSTVPIGAGQPVRFYKFVAVTFLCLTIILLGLIVFMGAKRAEITIITRSEAVDAVFPLEIGPGAEKTSVSGIVTTTVVRVAKIYEPKGTRQEVAERATGFVTLYNDSPVAQPLVATTRLLSPGGILFRMKKGATVPANGNLETEVYADKDGEASNLAEPTDFTIPGLSSARQKEVYAKSVKPLKAGIKDIGVVSEADMKKAISETLEALKSDGQKNLAAVFKDKKVYTAIIESSTKSNTDVSQETDNFTITGIATVAGVVIDDKQLAEQARFALGKQLVENSEVLESVADELSATLEEYDSVKGVAKLKVVATGFVNLDQNSRALQKNMFFGKTEDEVRRYLLSLDHVQSIEVKFRPVWNRTVPHIGDHVSVTVKQVK